ncbi:PPE domain-containing protein [Mycobacterium sp.]|uniref:PPE domain-containing protein n=1 Tax=Mycobacterium sp. TaxID=1785 RepID=UPI003A846BBA
MTAPVWLASPPEVHSALLSSGPGPAPLLASAAQWSSLSATYAEAAEEVSALVDGVLAEAWEGPSAAAYAAAHVPYLAWLVQAGADSAAMAAEQEAAAAAYTAALAAMPTLAELAANHAVHAALTATNFFGVNTIPIALNEADYVRMWIQAAIVMSTYQAVSAAAVAVAPRMGPAPVIVKADSAPVGTAAAQPSIQDRFDEFMQWLWQLYTAFYNNVIQPIVEWFANIPFLQTMFADIDPYLLTLGNPLTYFSPLNIGFAVGYPMDLATYITLLSQTFAFIGADLALAFASGNPGTIGLTIMFVTVEAIGTIITDTIALLKTTLESTLAITLAVVPLLAAPLAPLAAGAVLVPLGAKGLATLLAVPPPVPAAPAVPAPATLAPVAAPATPSPSPAPVESVTAAPAPGAPPSPPPTASPPTVTGAGVGAPMDAFGYLVGDLGSVAKRAAAAGARKKAPEPDSDEEPAIASAPQEPADQPRRRRAKVTRAARGYEYADLDEGLAAGGAGDGPAAAVTGAGRRAGTLGFAGVTNRTAAATAAGLITANAEAAPRVPMMPSTWEAGSAAGPSENVADRDSRTDLA